MEKKSGIYAHLWPSVISLIALGCSAVSLHQTILKQAELSTYVGDLGYLVWDEATAAEIIVLPVTVGNRGARDAVVLGLRLAAAPALTYRSSLVGGGPSALAQSGARSFAPWEIPGRGSQSGSVQLRAAGTGKLIAVPDPGAPVPSYAVCLTVRTAEFRPSGWLEHLLAPLGDVTPPPPLRFKVSPLERFSTQDMEGGRWVPLEITEVQPLDNPPAPDTDGCPATTQPDAGMH